MYFSMSVMWMKIDFNRDFNLALFYQRGLSVVDLYQQWNLQHSLHSEFTNNLKTSSKMLLQCEKGFWVVHSISSERIVYGSGFPDLNEGKLYVMT